MEKLFVTRANFLPAFSGVSENPEESRQGASTRK